MLTAAQKSPPEPYANPSTGENGGRERGERIYRHVNDRIRELERTYDFGEPLELFCECAAGGCNVTLAVDPALYAHVRALGTRFIVAPGHALTELETVVERRCEYWLVEERGA